MQNDQQAVLQILQVHIQALEEFSHLLTPRFLCRSCGARPDAESSSLAKPEKSPRLSRSSVAEKMAAPEEKCDGCDTDNPGGYKFCRFVDAQERI